MIPEGNSFSDRVEIELPPMFLNQSRYKNFQDCKRFYGWVFVEGLQHYRPRKQLVLGTAVHKAQVAIHEAGGGDEAVAEATAIADKFFATTMAPDGPKLDGDAEILKEGSATIRRLIPAYHRYWKEKGQQWKPLGQELDFCVEVGEGTNVWLVGTIDNLALFMQGLWIVDYKTMHKMDMREFTKYQVDIQLTAYIYGGSKQLTLNARKEGKPAVMIRGAIIDGMIKTQEPQFHRELYTRTIQELREFEQEFCFEAWDIAARHAMVRGNRNGYNLFKEKMFDLGTTNWKIAFPKSTNQCFRYGTCTHHDLCVKDNETRRLSYIKKVPDYVDAARVRAEKAKDGTESSSNQQGV